LISARTWNQGFATLTRKWGDKDGRSGGDGINVERYANYWLDLGNNADSGQFVLGEPLNRRNRRRGLRLRTVSELFPEVIQGGLEGDDLPSCSAAEALDRQEPFVNQTLANHALALRASLFRYGRISYHGGFISLSSLASVQALRVDPKHWQRFRNRGRLSKNP
jgi:PRTRC genetic system ThiF family protein